MGRTGKGNYGYINYEKKKRTLITLVMFAIPLTIYFTGLYQTGTRKNLFTLVEETEKRANDLTRAYELVVSAYEGTLLLDALVICGNQVVCCSTKGKKEQFAFMEKHMAKILNGNQYYSANVKIFSEAKPYLDRVAQLSADPEKYREGVTDAPGKEESMLSREERMKQVLMAISL